MGVLSMEYRDVFPELTGWEFLSKRAKPRWYRTEALLNSQQIFFLEGPDRGPLLLDSYRHAAELMDGGLVGSEKDGLAREISSLDYDELSVYFLLIILGERQKKTVSLGSILVQSDQFVSPEVGKRIVAIVGSLVEKGLVACTKGSLLNEDCHLIAI